MFGAISYDILMQAAYREGYREQLKFDFPIVAYINPKYCTDVPVETFIGSMGSMHYVDHPSFAALREALGSKGYIKIERGWSNGDRVLKPFYLNQILFEEGDKFCCATAMKWDMEKGTYLTHEQRYPEKVKEVVEIYKDEHTMELF